MNELCHQLTAFYYNRMILIKHDVYNATASVANQHPMSKDGALLMMGFPIFLLSIKSMFATKGINVTLKVEGYIQDMKY